MTVAVAAANKKELRAAFTKAGVSHIDKDVLSKCVALASNLHLSPEQMAECWDSFSMNKGGVSDLTDHTFQSYRIELIKQSETKTPTATEGAVQIKAVNREASKMVTPPAPKRPNNNNNNNSTTSSIDSVAKNAVGSPKRPAIVLPNYDQRTKVGEVVASFNPANLPPISASTPSKAGRCVIDTKCFSISNVEKPYRYMFTTMEERAKALEKHLATLGQQIVDRYGISDGENGIAPLEQVNVPRQEAICCVGRICNEAHTGKLNSTSVVLEGSSTQCGGARINVDLSQMKEKKTSYSLFPGQIVAVEGMNPTGRKLVAHRICEGAGQEANKSSIRDFRSFHYDLQDGTPMKVMSACGPFTTKDNMEYTPLIDLIYQIMEQTPDAVILTGPFVDMTHDEVSGGTLWETAEDGTRFIVPYELVFANKVAGILEEMYAENEDLHTQFVLVPSLEDATARSVFPQPPMQDGPPIKARVGGEIDFASLGLTQLNQGGKKQRVHCVSNPCTIKINEVVFGITSTDVLFHISAEETNASLEPGSRLRRISQHLLQQRSYYPLFPPPASIPTNLDLNYMEKWQMPCTPDILILPSRLASFATTVLENTVVVNPGHLSKGTTGGTYAVMEIHPMKRETLDASGADDVQILHSVNDRVNIEIKRI